MERGKQLITCVSDNLTRIEVGKDNVKSIELTVHGNEKTTIYKITYENGEYLFLGLLEHEVERSDYYD